jgi:hypothetical protein
MLIAAAASGCATNDARRDKTILAETRAVEFLKREVPAWYRVNACFSCHNNGDAARALYAANHKGYHVPPSILADTSGWVSQPNRWDHNKGDPGFSDKRLANIQFASSLIAAFEAGHVKDRRPLQEAARKVAGDQGDDGAWHVEPGNAVGSPATYGTTLATYMALKTLKQANASETSEAVRKAETWLRREQPNNVLSAATLLLASALETDSALSARPTSRGNRPSQIGIVEGFERATSSIPNVDSAYPVEKCLSLISRAQTQDGGWGPYGDSPPEPFDTAVVLLALRTLRHSLDIADMIQRGRLFLAAEQRADGSWPGTTRPPGGDSYAQCISTTGWATLALLATKE